MEERLRLWSELAGQEEEAMAQLGSVLAPLEPSLAIFHDAANWLTDLYADEEYEHHLLVAAGALKRALDDLRAIWLLLNRGYTSAAGAVAADLWEHATFALCASRDPVMAAQFEKNAPADRSFDAKKLAEAFSRWQHQGEEPPASPEREELTMLELYIPYRWLCQIKHPTYRAVQHTSSASVVDGVLGLTAGPDVREDDIATKKAVLVVVRLVFVDCLIHFGTGLQLDAERPEVAGWMEELERAKAIFEANVPLDSLKLPFGIFDFKETTRFKALRASLGLSESIEPQAVAQ